MTTQTLQRLTAEEFLQGNFDGYELVDGELVKVPMGALAAWVAGNLFAAIHAFSGTEGGLAFPQDTSISIWPERPNHFRKPDGMYFRAGRLPGNVPPSGTIDIAPDIAVEVVSPNDTAQDLETKVLEYLAAGVSLVWVLYPETRSVYVYRPGRDATRLSEGDMLEGEDVLPGFSVPVASLFSRGS